MAKKQIHPHQESVLLKKIRRQNIPLGKFVNWLRYDEFFHFLKFGDGEWYCIWENEGIIGQGKMPLSPEVQQEMGEGLKKHSRSPIIFGMQNYSLKRWTKNIEEFLEKNKLWHIVWANSDVFHYASRDGELFPFVQQLRRKLIVVIGPEYLRELPEHTFGYSKFIEVPEYDAYGEIERVEAEILATQKELGNGIVYSLSCGPLANVLIFHLWEQMLENSLINVGSLWDIFCGRRSRRYMLKRRYPDEILKRNLGLMK